ncbi:hypothetical protein GOBAR_DD04110 [Gossypium barbadense]|nr:hypothetical protein GOBAR_DD04110 [Gossypium barbadense]
MYSFSLVLAARSWMRLSVGVIGWGVSYGAEFVPSGENSYAVIIQKAGKVAGGVRQFQVALTIHNPTSEKKKLLLHPTGFI